MWQEYLKLKYSQETYERFLSLFGDSFPDVMLNEITGKVDSYYHTSLVMTFERRENLPNSERCFPQK